MSQSQTSTVTVFGQGVVDAVPDLTVLSIGVECRASTVALAYERAGQRVTAITAALREDAVPATDITTGALSVRSEVTRQDGVSRIAGYVATCSLRILLAHREPGDVAAVPDPEMVVAHAVEAGGDDARLGGLQHAFTDRTRMLSRARDDAWDDALDKARQYARRAARRLGPVLEITEDSTPGRTPNPGGVRLVAARSGGSSTVPLEPGEQEVSAALRVTWQLS